MDALLDDNPICDAVNVDQSNDSNKTDETDKKKSTGMSNEEVEEQPKKRRKQIFIASSINQTENAKVWEYNWTLSGRLSLLATYLF